MDSQPLGNLHYGVKLMSLDSSHKPGKREEIQEQSQQGSRAEPSPPLWSSIADPDEFWSSEYNETFEFAGLEAFNDCSEPGVSTTNRRCGNGNLSELPNWKFNIEGMEPGDHNIVPGHGTLPPGPRDSQTAQGNTSMDVSHPLLQSSTGSALYRQATGIPKNLFEEIGAPLTPESPTDLERPKSLLSVPLPRVVISHTAIENAGDGKKSAVSDLHANTSSTTTQFDIKENLRQDLHKSLASSVSSSQHSDVNWYRPNNYEIAMHERQPPHIAATEIEPQFGTLAAESVDAFYADADSIISNNAVSSTAESPSVKRRRLPRNFSTFHITTKTPPWSQHWQSSSCNALTRPILQNSSQTPMYPSPPSSFIGIAEYQQFGSVSSRDEPPSTPAISSCASPIEPVSPISPSPSSFFDTADGITRCPSCPDKIFTGTPVDQKNSLQRHMRDIHRGMPRLECFVRECTVTFAPGRKDNRIKHVRATHPDYPLPPPSKKRSRNADSDFESC